MRKFLAIIILALLTQYCYAQSPSIVAEWYCPDSTMERSMFLKADSSIIMESREMVDGISTPVIRKGNYVLERNVLIINWAGGEIDKFQLKFLDNNNFQMTVSDPSSKRKRKEIIFHRIMVEQVTERKP